MAAVSSRNPVPFINTLPPVDPAQSMELKRQAVQEIGPMLTVNNFRAVYDKIAALFGAPRDLPTIRHFITPLQNLNTDGKIKALMLDHLRKYIKVKDQKYLVLDSDDDKTRYSIQLCTRTLQSSGKDISEWCTKTPDNYNDYIEQDAMMQLWLRSFGITSQPLDIVMGQVQVKVSDKWLPTTRHIALVSCNDSWLRRQVEYTFHSSVQLLHTAHQDFPLHEQTMSDLFNMIVDRNTPKADLHKLIREFEYRLHHLCYLLHGNTVVNEVILEAIRDTIYPEYVLKGNLAALAEPYLSKYI